jgi:predicted aspartyl protease
VNLRGACDEALSPHIEVELRGRFNHVTCKVLLDTGYSGWLKLDTSLADHLGVESNIAELVQLADGSIREVPMSQVELLCDSAWIKGLAHVGDGGSMIGMQALADHRIQIHAFRGGPVIVEPA